MSTKKITDIEEPIESSVNEKTEQAAPAPIAKTAAARKKKETQVYVGPTIVGVAVQYTFYNNGIPAELMAAIAENPAIGSLVVPVAKLGDAMKAINNKQGALHIQYETAKQFKPKKGE